MNDVTIEHATEDDAESIRALIREARINPTSLDWQNFFVARHPDLGLVGCGQIRNAPFGAGREVKSLVVREGFRDGQVARALLRALIAEEHEAVWGTCVATLAPYYLRFGCEMPPPDEIPRYYKVMGGAAVVVHRITRGESPKMVVLRFRPPGPSGA